MAALADLMLTERMRGLARSSRKLDLEVKSEFAVLESREDMAALVGASTPPAAGAIVSVVQPHHIPEAVMKERLHGRVAGSAAPPWHDGSDGALMSGVAIGRVRNACHLPEYGAVITRAGEVIESTIAEARYLTPSLAALPGVSMTARGPELAIPRGTPVIDRAAVFMPWGGRFNYGHFLIDGLTSLAALDEQHLLDRWRPITPPLTDWQRQGLRLYLGEERAAKVCETSAPIVHVDDLVFSTPMNHFLHAPNKPLDLVRRRMSDAVPAGTRGPSRLYVNRHGDPKRPMVNEPELETALVRQGFVSVAPEKLPLSEQIALFRDADVIVAPTGAALANVLFCKPGAKVFEIQPSNFAGIWVRQIAHFIGADWHGLFTPSPLSETPVRIEGMDRPSILFRWKVSVPEVMAWVDAGLGAASPSLLKRA